MLFLWRSFSMSYVCESGSFLSWKIYVDLVVLIMVSIIPERHQSVIFTIKSHNHVLLQWHCTNYLGKWNDNAALKWYFYRKIIQVCFIEMIARCLCDVMLVPLWRNSRHSNIYLGKGNARAAPKWHNSRHCINYLGKLNIMTAPKYHAGN